MFKIGHGYDVHKIINKEKPLILGGINIEANFSLKAHSDGDVVLHALCDSLLGALGLGDIGNHFPDVNDKYKNKCSSYFVQQVVKFLKEKNYKVCNIDITVITEVPKISLYSSSMCKKISGLLKLNINQINVKATTTEKLGFIGRKEAIACHSITLISEEK